MSLKIDRVQLEIVIQQDQARQKMIELEDKMRSANRELKNVKKQFGENSAEYAKQVEVLKKLQQEYDNLYDEIGLTNLSLRDLGKRQKDLNAILRQLNPNTELYKQYSEQLKEVNNRIKSGEERLTKRASAWLNWLMVLIDMERLLPVSLQV